MSAGCSRARLFSPVLLCCSFVDPDWKSGGSIAQWLAYRNSAKKLTQKTGETEVSPVCYINCFCELGIKPPIPANFTCRCLMGIACAHPILREPTYQAISSIKVVRLFCVAAVWEEPFILL